MSILHPQSTEDRLAIIPLVGCWLPLIIAVLVIAFLIWRLT